MTEKVAKSGSGSFWTPEHRSVWLRPTSALALLHLFCVGINIDAEAATFVVDSTVDAVDATPGNGVCATSGAVCTLRAAIQESNALAGADTVTVPAGTYTLTLGDLVVTDQLTVPGAGQATTIVDGQALDRVFDIAAGITASLSNLTVRNGNIVGFGGGIRNAGDLTLTNVTVRDNIASASGGGIRSQGATTSLTLTNVTFSNNTASNRGGGIYLQTLGATLVMTGGSISDNTATNQGGGIYNDTASATLNNVTVSGNNGSNGGGIFSDNPSSTLTITDSTFSSNQATVADGGAIMADAGVANISSSTFNANTALRDGGAIMSKDATTSLVNITVSGNSAARFGGGATINVGTLSVTNVTITNNSALTNGGGLHVASGVSQLLNTIVANSTSGGDCSGTITDLGNNLDTDGTCPVGFLTAPPLLGPLANNGGPTFTHELLAGSPAAEAGTNTGCPATDQRGIARPIAATCDIGSYETSTGICPGGVVTTTAGSGASSLRECINYANTIPGTTIQFNIPGPGNRSAGADIWWGISPATPLPTVTAAGTVIDGTTQTTNQGDTNSRGPEIELDGTSAGATAHGLVIGATGGGSTIRGLVVQHFVNNGILLLGGSNVIAGNYLGIGADGTTVHANNPAAVNYQGGIRVESSSNTIGGTTAADRNVISGNGFAGIELFGAGASGNEVYGNYIGVDATGTLNRGNTQEGIDLELGSSNIIGGPGAGQRNIISGNDSDGIEIDGGDFNIVQGNYIGTDVTGTVVIANGRDGIDINANGADGAMTNLIGGTSPNEGNLIRGNSIYGIQVRGAPASNNPILGNQIYGNVALDLDLNNDGITINDPLDADAGSNDLLNYPMITSATEAAGILTVDFLLDVPAGDYRIEFFTNPSGAHSSGNGGGEVLADATTITHGGTGLESFSHSFAGSAGDIITTTATEVFVGPLYASTSEFSTAVTATLFTPFNSSRWPLDETSGLTAVDIDAGNDGTYQNGVLLNQAAACTDTGNAVYFDGIDDFVEVPHSPDYLMYEGTVTLWANVDAFGTAQSLFSKDSTDFDTGGHLTINVQPGGQIRVRLQSTTADNFVNSAPVSPATWIHVAFSWGPAGMALYLDGAAPVTNPYTGGLGTTSGGAGNFEPIAFGASTKVSGNLVVTPTEEHLAGYMDDVRIYNRALTLPEIQTLAACTPNLSIVKTAFEADGTPIPTGSTIPNYLEVKYLLYINNTGGARTDVTLRDVLDPAFQYQPGTIQVDNSVVACALAGCTVAEELAIFTAVDGAAFLSDAVDADVGSYTGASSSVDAGNQNVANLQLDINADAVWAILFSVKMP